MGKRGPKPKPTALKELQGNPGKRRLNSAEPKPAAAVDLAAPPGLKGDAVDEWNRLAPQLATLKILTDLDRNVLANYCACFGLLQECQAWLVGNGTTIEVETKNGIFTTQAPQFTQAMKLMAQMKSLGAELGLSPSSRSNLKPDSDQPGAALAAFLAANQSPQK